MLFYFKILQQYHITLELFNLADWLGRWSLPSYTTVQWRLPQQTSKMQVPSRILPSKCLPIWNSMLINSEWGQCEYLLPWIFYLFNFWVCHSLMMFTYQKYCAICRDGDQQLLWNRYLLEYRTCWISLIRQTLHRLMVITSLSRYSPQWYTWALCLNVSVLNINTEHHH